MKARRDKWYKRHRWLLVLVGILLLVLAWQALSDRHAEEEKALRSQVRELVHETFPEQAADYEQTLGLFPHLPQGDGPRSVVLIHGLDDPGKVWRSLAPALAVEGCQVWLMQYPNDQPIAESADLFFGELQGLRQEGVEQIAIVGHSMGGLVARELLTSPEIGYHASQENGTVPRVDTLVMVATPNNGSPLARGRAFAELRDQFAKITAGQASWVGFILDGAGEAKIDLLPGSRFLSELNGRPHPEGVELLSIAGITSPWTGEDIDRWAANLSSHTDGTREEEIEALRGVMAQVTDGLGDGLVTVESTRLEEVPHITVSGTHLSMIRNIMADSDRIPPAVPVIVDRLTDESNP